MQREHDFSESLAYSHAQADAPWWRQVYQTAFPDIVSAECVRRDGWAQRGGIDRVIVRACGKTHYVDEKVRKRDSQDILLEYLSDQARRRPGWVEKDLACDFIAYAFVPSQRCFLLPFETLRRAWRMNGSLWICLGLAESDGFKCVAAHNKGWVTRSVAVPIPTLFHALNDAMLIRWRHCGECGR